MLRRKAVGILLGGCAAAASPRPRALSRFMQSSRGTAVLVGASGWRLLGVHEEEVAGSFLAPPGSTLKPLALQALIKAHKLRAEDAFLCPGRLRIGGRVFDCSHPPLDAPMRIETALAYSCNGFVAHAAERFRPGELAVALDSLGLASRTGWLGAGEVSGSIRAANSPDAIRTQALGEEGVLVTAAGLAQAWGRLALSASNPEMTPVLTGLVGAVEYGTAQLARVAGAAVAGKTGSTRTAAGAHIAWFAGFMPAAAPEVVVVVMLAGRAGGADAAPVAGRILAAYREGRL